MELICTYVFKELKLRSLNTLVQINSKLIGSITYTCESKNKITIWTLRMNQMSQN